MMNEAEIIRLIKKTVRLELAQTLLGSITETDDEYTTSMTRFATDSEIEDLRLIRPYGFASRPNSGVTTVVHPVNGDPSHLLSLGDFDEGNRPSILEGESAVYGSSGQVIYTEGTDIFLGDYIPVTGTFVPNHRAAFHEDGSYELGILESVSSNAAGEVFIGSPEAANPLVLGDILKNFCDQLITILTTALAAIEAGPLVITTTPGNPAPTSPQIIAAMATAITQINTLQSTLVDNPATNFISLTNFTERGVV